MNEIDYSEVMQPQIVSANEEWEPPVHKYFGKKLPNGKTEKEPVYIHQEYPRFMYTNVDGKIKARVVSSSEEQAALGPSWAKTPAEFGYIGAPSFEQTLQMKSSYEPQEEPAKRGRPVKA